MVRHDKGHISLSLVNIKSSQKKYNPAEGRKLKLKTGIRLCFRISGKFLKLNKSPIEKEVLFLNVPVSLLIIGTLKDLETLL